MSQNLPPAPQQARAKPSPTAIEVAGMAFEKVQQAAKRIVRFQANLRHLDSQLADRGRRIALVHQLPLREHMANVGKPIVLFWIFGFGHMHEVEQASHRQRDPQRMHECNGAAFREIGWMYNRLNPMRHDVPLT
jgi:hypothetical protein